MPTLTQEAPYSILGTYLFYVEEFSIDEEDDQIILYHPRWPLAGSGKYLHEAEQDLTMRAKILFQAYSGIPKKELSDDANEMLDFLRKIS